MSPSGAAVDLPTGTATFLFTDIQGSTQLVQALGAERWQAILETHYRLLREQFSKNGGAEVNTEGDAFFMAFAQARDAVAACAAGQRALQAHDWPDDAVIRVRMGLHTGEAAMVGTDYVGLDIHRAARIASSAHGGQVVLSDATRLLVESALPDGVGLIDLGEHRLKDLARPERIWQLRIDGLGNEFPALKSLDRTANNLPVQLTSFVGRDRDLAEGLRLLRSTRLLTLTGPGGTGKTRLTLQMAAEASDDFKDGVFFVPLAPITDPALVPSAVLQVIGVQDVSGRSPADVLLEYVASRQLLLVMDNFEQILDAAPYVAEILKAGPQTKILTSSRAALRVYGEQEFPIAPLGVPDPAAVLSVDALSQYEAVQLFIERAMAIKPDFAVTNENAPAVAGITALVDGLPLAIELAASRIRLLTPQAIFTRLEGRLGELGGGSRDLPERQQTLRGAIAWSYDLLEPGVQTLFARFAVFSRGASLEQIEAVCGATGELGVDVIDGLGSLVDHNLLRTVDDVDEPRFFMLHVIREYALERFTAADDADAIRERHARAYADLAEAAAPRLTGSEQKAWLDRLELDHDNLRTALAWAMDHDDGVLGTRLVTALWRFWQIRGYLFEARQRTDALVALPGLQVHPRELSDALEAAGGIAYWQGDQDAAGERYYQALAIERAGGDKQRLANALYNASFPDMMKRTDLVAVRALVEEAIALYRDLDDQAGLAKALWGIGNMAYFLEPPDWDLAITSLTESTGAFELLGDQFGLAWSLYTLGLAIVGRGNVDEAMPRLKKALELFDAAADKAGLALMMNAFAMVAYERGDMVRAARLEGVRRAIEAQTGVGLLGSRARFLQELEEAVEQLDATMPEESEVGRQMSIEAAIAYALEGAM